MTLIEFGRLLEESPSLLGSLLQQQGCIDSVDLQSRIIAFFGLLNQDDVMSYRKHQKLQPSRVIRMAQLAGLESKLAYIPLRIFEDYDSQRFGDKSKLRPFTDEEVVFWLTGGLIPAECCFLVDGQFCIWDNEKADFLITGILDGDPNMHSAAADYLAATGSSFSTMLEAKAEASRRHLN